MHGINMQLHLKEILRSMWRIISLLIAIQIKQSGYIRQYVWKSEFSATEIANSKQLLHLKEILRSIWRIISLLIAIQIKQSGYMRQYV